MKDSNLWFKDKLTPQTDDDYRVLYGFPLEGDKINVAMPDGLTYNNAEAVYLTADSKTFLVGEDRIFVVTNERCTITLIKKREEVIANT